MSKNSAFKVYNASAGSGKTFTLVKAYLKLLFSSKNPTLFRNILALTFTNKAVNEMKTRIIDTLKQFSKDSILASPNSMFSAITEELNAKPENIHLKSITLLNSILHNYAAFDISTIDKFTHNVIRTFAFDLKIPVNFEVELDTDRLLSEAVDNLIAKAGSDKELTKVLVDFAIEKADDDRSWDISFDFNKIAKLLVNENDIPFLEPLKEKTIADFKLLKNILLTEIVVCEEAIVEKASQILTFISECGLDHNDFSGKNGIVPSYFVKLANKQFGINYNAPVWMQKIETHPLYPKTTEASIASIIDDIQPQIAKSFYETKQLIFQYRFHKNFYKNLTPLSVLNVIQSELDSIKQENDLLLISEFNKIIHNEIKHQPTPFIYERLGEKFKHYFIDEFQDTSELQWENLIPLIDNRISGAIGTAMIVGDAKQSIYRWRGGKPELFMALYNKKSQPFSIEQDVVSLDFNYRSCRNIVEFNNRFFQHLSTFAFQNPVHAQLFLDAKQEKHLEEDGFVNLEFLEFSADDNRDDLYTDAVKQTIENIISNDFELKDICILVRKKKEGVAIADYLTEQGIPVISSETLLINRSPKVQFITNTLKVSTQPENKELKANILYFISKLLDIKDAHTFLETGLLQTLEEVSASLLAKDIVFNFNTIAQLSLYSATEYVIRAFNLVETSDAYIQFYLDTVLEYSQKHSSSLIDFLEYWEQKKETLSITIPEGENAVQVMTIHKSKGLEFPVVIFPYADLNIYREKEPKTWFPINNEAFNGFSHALLNYNKDIAEFGADGESIHSARQSNLELDTINLLYVTLTRAVEQLYVISKKEIDSKGNEKLNDYSGLLINYLKSIDKWDDAKITFSFGKPKKQLNHSSDTQNTFISKKFISNTDTVTLVTNAGYLWDTEQEHAIEKGNLLHDLFAKIKTPTDIDFVLNESLRIGDIDLIQKKMLKASINDIVNHPKLKPYYADDVLIYNERDIISSNGSIIRPDRLVINKNNEAVIIDYKTGVSDKKHMQQLITYADVIETMNIKVNKKILIYINDTIKVEEI